MAVRTCSKCCQLLRVFRARVLFVRIMMHPYFSVGPSRQREALVSCSRRAGSSGISWRILSLVKKTLRCHRAGFELQRTLRSWHARPSHFGLFLFCAMNHDFILKSICAVLTLLPCYVFQRFVVAGQRLSGSNQPARKTIESLVGHAF
jgi:hypothetical protein